MEHERNYIIRFKDGHNEIYKESEIIKNALEQEKDGVKPSYIWYTEKKNGDIETVGNPGWLVWSTWGGCGVCYRRNDGGMIILTGWQSDFMYI